MTKIDVTSSPFMHIKIVEADQWMADNIGNVVYDTDEMTIGDGWKLYMIRDVYREDHGRWYIEIDDSGKAAWFMLRWT